MNDLPTEVIARLKAPRLIAAALMELEFAAETVRVWNGAGQLTTSDGRSWEGVHEYGSISSIEAGSANEAPGFTIELRTPGRDWPQTSSAFAAAVKQALREDVFGRPVRLYLQVFDLGDHSLVGAPQAMLAALMVNVEAELVGSSSLVRVQCEHRLAWGRMPPAAFLTSADQQTRFPGDQACDYTAVLPVRRVRWPRD